VHTFIAQGRQNEAWSLMTTLRRDAEMPNRLQAELEEMQAWWYYNEEQFDSAAFHLEEALPAAGNILEKSRWEYLAAQMYERAGKKEDANRMFGKCISHTTDPVMEAYARISQIRLVSGDDEEKRIRMNLDALMDMSKKAKYEEYRHIIFYAAAQLELSREKPQEAIGLYKKSLQNNSSDAILKNTTFLELGNLAFDQREYRLAYNCYDSLSLEGATESQTELIGNRIAVLNDLLSHMENIRVEDSLQKIAAMPEAERNNYLKSQVRKLRKEKGLKEEESQTSGASSKTSGNFQSNEVVDIFATNNSKGEWYFYNTSLKSQGSKQFQSNWGNRPNLDNWRRMTAVNNQINAVTIKQSGEPEANAGIAANSKAQPTDISMEGLLANIPLTAAQKEQSDDTIQQSLYRIGKIFQDKLGDCDETILYFEKLLNRYPQTKYQEEALFGLCYCYQKAGNTEKLNFYKGFLTRNFNQSKYLKYLNNPALAKDEKRQIEIKEQAGKLSVLNADEKIASAILAELEKGKS
jgi:outer membrane protein assembly factor BamD (BamD/ComL family)